MTAPTPKTDPLPPHLLGDLGLTIDAVGEDLHGRADVNENMWVPGTTALRMSILISWADTLLGLLAMTTITPRMPVTLDLAVGLYEPIVDCEAVHMVGRVVKAGASVVVLAIEFSTESGLPLGIGNSLFIAAPDPGLSMPTGSWALDRFRSRRGTLVVPFAQRAGCTRLGAGVASLPLDGSLLNSAKTLNGGLVSLVVEEAALCADTFGRTLSSMSLQYIRPVRVGPAVARAELRGALGTVDVRDSSTNALCIAGTTRLFDQGGR